MIYARIGAALYIIWGLMHLAAGSVGIWLTGQPITPDWAAGMAAVPSGDSGVADATVGLVRQHSFNIAVGGAMAILIAVFGNWNNRRLAWILNGALIASLDLGMIIFMLIPGYVPLVDGLIGPALWIAGLAFTTLGQTKGASKLPN